MKSFLLAILILTSSYVIGQMEKAIVNENCNWSTLEVHCMPNGNNYSTYFIKFEGDTIIDSYVYKKIWRCDEESQINWGFYGFIREDENKRVFLKPPDYYEGMIYDFSVSVGDTIEARNVYLNNDTLHFVVTQIDSVLLLTDYRKRIKLFEYINQKEEIWVEGLGSYFGILNSCNDSYGGACGGYEALCYEETGTIVYQHPSYSTCYYAAPVGTNEINASEIMVYPNPAKDFVSIDFYDDSKREIELFDLTGKKILKKVTTNRNFILYLQEVDNGIYLINVFDGKNYYPPYKLIVD